MAPKSSKRGRDDDFVLTLSDNEDGVPIGEDEEFADEAPAPGKKRKRAAEEGVKLKEKPSKRKKGGKHKGKTEGSDEEASEPDEPTTWADDGEDDGAMVSDFEFQTGAGDENDFGEFDGWNLNTTATEQKVGGDKKGVDIDDIIARRQRGKPNGFSNGVASGAVQAVQAVQMDEDEDEEDEAQSSLFAGLAKDDDDETLAADGFGMGAASDDEDLENGADSASDSDEGDDASDSASEAEAVAHPDDVSVASQDDQAEDPEEAARRAAFFAPEDTLAIAKPDTANGSSGFQSMSLSRPILKGLTAVGFATPTPIQSKTIPVALLGKDVVGGAVTGSGKTAAFVIPILERLLYRPKKVATTRVIILMPTRELAVQCFNVAKKLASFTDITFALTVGGFSLREQEIVLKSRPDVVIATPGRFIDHMRNSASFVLDAIEILVLDEADRMLEDGFADELNEILTTIPKSRQTMLFSATVTDTVDKLIRVGLNRPVRLLVDAKRQTVKGLVQEFVRLRPGREDKRLAYLMWLCEQVYTEKVIVFFRQKKEAHRVRVVFALCGLKAAELHGSMSQEQRISSVEAFRAGKVSFLLATDLASRGLDIKGVDTVINYEAPQSHEIYLHRVGRTARAGRTGRACTLAAEPDRKVVKAAVKAARVQGAKIASRVVPVEEADVWGKKLVGMDEEIEDVLKEEKEERAMTQAERDVKKGENLVEHEHEIMSRPRRTWFETDADKKKSKEAGWRELNAGEPGAEPKSKGGKKKLSNKEKKRLDMRDERKETTAWKKGKGDADGIKAAKKGKAKAKLGKPSKPGKPGKKVNVKGRR